MKAVKKHTQCKWVILYVERWLKTPMQLPDGKLQEKTKGVMQGGVISPVLSNLFLHYVFDVWMKRNHPKIPWCRYADDGLAHCNTKQEAQQLLAELQERFKACGLELHPDKTKIVYCKDGKRRSKYPNVTFNFLGYCFRQRVCKNTRDNHLFINFTPAVSKQALNAMRSKTRKLNVRNRTELSLEDIAQWFNPILQGWINYYGKYTKTAMRPIARHFNCTLVAWAMKKYRHLGKSKIKAGRFMENIAKTNRHLFAHWRIGWTGGFA